MKDPIERQDVIDLLSGVYHCMGNWLVQYIENGISSIPSAQPEKRTENTRQTHSCDLIDRQAAIEETKKCYHHCTIPDDYHISAVDIQYRISKLPSVTPKTKTGKWIVRYECPNCGEGRSYAFDTCPMCGRELKNDK